MSRNESRTMLLETSEEYVQATVALLAEQRDNLLYVGGGKEEAMLKQGDDEATIYAKMREATRRVMKNAPTTPNSRKKAAAEAVLRSPHAMTFMMRIVRARTVLANHSLWNVNELWSHLHGVYGGVSLMFNHLATDNSNVRCRSLQR